MCNAHTVKLNKNSHFYRQYYIYIHPLPFYACVIFAFSKIFWYNHMFFLCIDCCNVFLYTNANLLRTKFYFCADRRQSKWEKSANRHTASKNKLFIAFRNIRKQIAVKNLRGFVTMRYIRKVRLYKNSSY